MPDKIDRFPLRDIQFSELLRNSNSDWAIAIARSAPIASQNPANPEYNKPDVDAVTRQIDTHHVKYRLFKKDKYLPGADQYINNEEVEAYLKRIAPDQSDVLYKQYLDEKKHAPSEDYIAAVMPF